jgi:cytochrome c oxidase subunit 2
VGFRFPGEDGALGQVEVSRMSVDNPFGMKEEDQRVGMCWSIIGELHVPIDTNYKFVLRARDVLHNFTVTAIPHGSDTRYIYISMAQTYTPGSSRYHVRKVCGIGHFAIEAQ